MKRKIFLIILIGILSYFAWKLFISLVPAEPIEIVPEKSKSASAYLSVEATTNDTKNETVLENESQENRLENQKSTEINLAKSEEDNEEIEIETPENTTPEISVDDSFIINKKVSWGYSASSGRTIDTLVIHSSYDALGDKPYDLDGLIAEYKQYSVAPHFVIDRKGKVYRLVDEKNIAYHAGTSTMPDGRTGVNNFSIGIELMNTEDDDYASKQYSALNDLIDYLKDKYSIK